MGTYSLADTRRCDGVGVGLFLRGKSVGNILWVQSERIFHALFIVTNELIEASDQFLASKAFGALPKIRTFLIFNLRHFLFLRIMCDFRHYLVKFEGLLKRE